MFYVFSRLNLSDFFLSIELFNLFLLLSCFLFGFFFVIHILVDDICCSDGSFMVWD